MERVTRAQVEEQLKAAAEAEKEVYAKMTLNLKQAVKSGYFTAKQAIEILEYRGRKEGFDPDPTKTMAWLRRRASVQAKGGK